MANGPVRQREFDLYREGVEHRLRELERRIGELDHEHETDMDALATRGEERRRWTREQIVAVVAAAALVGALALQALGR